MNRSAGILVVLLAIGCADAPRDNPLDPLSPSYKGEAAVTGSVTLKNLGTPVTLAQVRAVEEGVLVTSDSAGRFAFRRLSPGTQTIVCTKDNFSPDTQRVVLTTGASASVTFLLNGAPVVLSQKILSRKIDQYFPSPQYFVDVSTAVTDPNGITDLDSVWFAVDSLKIPMDYLPSTKLFQTTVFKYDLPTNTIQWLVGKPLHIISRDRSKAVNISDAFFVTRVIENGATPSSPSSANNDTTNGTPILKWSPPSVTFNYTYSLSVLRVDAGTEAVVWVRTEINSTYEEFQFPVDGSVPPPEHGELSLGGDGRRRVRQFMPIKTIIFRGAMNAGRPEQNSFEALYQITRALNSILEPELLLHQILESAMAHLNAERGFVLLADRIGEHGFSVAAAKNFGPQQSSNAFAASSSVVRTVLETGTPVLTYDALTDERFEASTSIIAQKILSIICIPLRSTDRTTGAVYLDSSVSRKAFTEESMKFLAVVGHLAAIALENAQRYAQLQSENRRLQEAVDLGQRFTHLIGTSKRWKGVLERMERVLDVDAAVLLTGESGTGKELIARTIHDHGTRSGRPFVAVNCSAIPDQLMESEMFGYMRGAFTGASSDKKGLVEVAEAGTLFLDEIADLSAPLQSKLLRLLQEKEYRRVGDTKNRTADIRVIAATNRPLAEDVKQGRMREDLYFRLNVIGIHLPPLRERKEDVPLLAQHFLRRASEQYRRPVESIHPEAMQVLLTNEWRGNIRELQNTIERAVVLCHGTQLTRKDFVHDDFTGAEQHAAPTTLADLERQVIETTLVEMGGNRTKTAERLGVSLRWLQYRLKAWKSGSGE